jgi:hypothetical protein
MAMGFQFANEDRTSIPDRGPPMTPDMRNLSKAIESELLHTSLPDRGVVQKSNNLSLNHTQSDPASTRMKPSARF